MNDSEAAIRNWAAQRHLGPPHLERWLAIDEAGRAALLAIALELRLRAGQLTVALEMLPEIALMKKSTIASTLECEAVRRAIDGSGSAPARAARFLEILRALRFPRLSRARAALQAEVRALALAPGVSVQLPRELASDELVVELRARTVRELNQALDALARRRDDLARILARLGGTDDEL